jgi:hypothetical protein
VKVRTSCGWCAGDARHELCPVRVEKADGKGGPWYCYCAELRPELHRRMNEQDT